MNSKPLNILLIGFGSIGRRHFNLLSQHFSHEVYLLRHENLALQYKSFPFYNQFFSWGEVEKSGIDFDVAMICNPTNLHIQTAIKCAEMGIKNIFIEKPISNSLDGLDTLFSFCREKKITTYVAYPFRFNETVKKAKEVLQQNYIMVCSTDISKWYPDRRIRSIEEGGGHLLELSHELDIAEYLYGPYEMYAMCKVDESKTKGLVVVKAFHESGVEGMIYLDTEAEEEKRAIIIGSQVFEYSILEADYLKQLKWFFDNLGHHHMMNDIFDASPLLEKILKVQNGINKGQLISVSL